MARVFKLLSVAAVLAGIVAVVAVVSTDVSGQVRRSDPFSEFRMLGGTPEIGVELRDVGAEDVTRGKLPAAAGAVVADVAAESPASKAGFKAGDIVVAFDGEKVRSARQLTRLIEETPEGRDVAATVIRDGAQVQLKVATRMAESPLAAAFGDPFSGGSFFSFPAPGDRSFGRPGLEQRPFEAFPNLEAPQNPARLGVEVTDLGEQLGDYFGTRVGVLVTSVADGTAASAAGLKAGDVIMRVGTQLVRNADDLRRRVAAASGEVELTVMRDRKEVVLKATLNETEPATPSKRIVK